MENISGAEQGLEWEHFAQIKQYCSENPDFAVSLLDDPKTALEDAGLDFEIASGEGKKVSLVLSDMTLLQRRDVLSPLIQANNGIFDPNDGLFDPVVAVNLGIVVNVGAVVNAAVWVNAGINANAAANANAAVNINAAVNTNVEVNMEGQPPDVGVSSELSHQDVIGQQIIARSNPYGIVQGFVLTPEYLETALHESLNQMSLSTARQASLLSFVVGEYSSQLERLEIGEHQQLEYQYRNKTISVLLTKSEAGLTVTGGTVLH